MRSPATDAHPHKAALRPAGADTRRRILDAAVEVLVAEGHASASTLQIQKVAGVSRGSLLHHFASREALLVGAVSHLASRYMVNSGSWSRRHEDGTPQRIDAAVADMWSNYQQDHFWAATELWIAARHNPALATALKPVERIVGIQVHAAIAAYFGPTFASLPQFDELATHLNTSMRGVALTYAFNGRRAQQSDDLHIPGWRNLARKTLLNA